MNKLRTSTQFLILYSCFIIFMFIIATSCAETGNTAESRDYTAKTIELFNSLEAPVVLFAKKETWGMYSISVIDGDGKITAFGNMSTLANQIGDTYERGDTLTFKK